MKTIIANNKKPYISVHEEKDEYSKDLINIVKKNIPGISESELRRMFLSLSIKGSNAANLANILLKQINYNDVDFKKTFGFSLLDFKKEKIDCNKLMVDMYSKIYLDIMNDKNENNYDMLNKYVIHMLNNNSKDFLNRYLEISKADFDLSFELIKADEFSDFYHTFRYYISMLAEGDDSVLIRIPKYGSVSLSPFRGMSSFSDTVSDTYLRFLGLDGKDDLIVAMGDKYYTIPKENYTDIKYYKITRVKHVKEKQLKKDKK